MANNAYCGRKRPLVFRDKDLLFFVKADAGLQDPRFSCVILAECYNERLAPR